MSAVIESVRTRTKTGYSVFPIRAGTKQPAVKWTRFQTEFISESEIESLFSGLAGVGRVCGAISGNHEVIDFDVDEGDPVQLDELFNEFQDKVGPELMNKLTIVRTPRPGYHVSYRCQLPVDVAKKLAGYETEDGRPKFFIETRGEGSYVLDISCPAGVHPSGRTYEHVAGPTLEDSRPITKLERDKLLDVARTFCQIPEVEQREFTEIREFTTDKTNAGLRPGDDFANQVSWREILEPHGYEFTGKNHRMIRRPGTTNRWSGCVNDSGNLLVWSPNTPFPQHPGAGDGPTTTKFGAYALLRCGGDHEEAARELAENGFGEKDAAENFAGMEAQIDAILDKPAEQVEPDPEPDPLPEFPSALLAPGGVLERIMDHNLAGAFLPQPAFALSGAIAILSAVAGRIVKDIFDTRTNLYLINIGPTGCGKARAMKAGTEILTAAGLEQLIGMGSYHSGSALEEEVNRGVPVIAQIDEFGKYLASVTSRKASEHRAGVVRCLLELYSSSNTWYRSGGYVDRERNKAIAQPCFSLLGLTTPEGLIKGLRMENLNDGLLNRCLFVEAGRVSMSRDIKPVEVSDLLIASLHEIRKHEMAGGGVGLVTPKPILVEHDPDAKREAFDYMASCHEHIDDSDPSSAMRVRAGEAVNKLALIKGLSDNPERPVIRADNVRWAIKFVELQFSWVRSKSADIEVDEFAGKCQKILNILKQNGGQYKARLIHQKCRWPDFKQVIKQLDLEGQITVKMVEQSSGQKSKMMILQ